MSLNNRLKRKIRKEYGMDLLPVALESYKLGDVVEWDGLIKNINIRKINPDFENYSFVNFLKISKELKEELKTQLSNVESVTANMPLIKIDSSYEINTGTDIPNFAAEIGIEVGNESFTEFNIENIKSKTLGGDLKFRLRQLFLEAKEDDKKYYRKELKHLFYIDKLYYAGTASFNLKNTSEVKVEAAVTKSKLINPKVEVKHAGDINVSFSGNQLVPFAADIESIRDLID